MTIELDDRSPWKWDLCLDGTPIRKGYTDPNEAAFEANRKDVGDPQINSLLRGLYVPGDLRAWSKTKLVHAEENNQLN